MNTAFRSGFVTIIGCPNAGKSTLLNCLVGQKVAIVSSKAQTTRNKIIGVVTKSDYQIVFLDTPGIISPRNRLGDYMLDVAHEAMKDVEGILLVLDAAVGIGERDRQIIERLSKYRVPRLAWVNKTDIASRGNIEECCQAVEEAGYFYCVFKGSAYKGDGVFELEKTLSALMPEGPRYFPEDMVTDQPERVICGEIIREKALLLLRDEIPHGVGVCIDKMSLRQDIDLMDIYATIYCERDSHKGIIIGKGGSMLKKIGRLAREDIESLIGNRVNLQIWIKVKEDWRNKPTVLHELGYE